MALRLFELIAYSKKERESAEKLPADSPERTAMMERKLAALKAKREKEKSNEQPTEQ